MGNRSVCPLCASPTALGNIICFKCGYKPTFYKRTYIYDTLGVDKEDQSKLKIPKDIIFNPNEFHIQALKWLYSCQIYKDIIIKYKFGYLPSWHRVFIPTFDDKGTLLFYQLRALDDANDIKYMTFGSCKDSYSQNIQDYSKPLVIVEDQLSYIRVKKFHNCMSLHGSTISDNAAQLLIRNIDKFIFWLDPDRPGQLGKHKVINKLKEAFENEVLLECWTTNSVSINDKEILCVNRKNITKDPKHYTDYEIEYILNNEVILCDY